MNDTGSEITISRMGTLALGVLNFVLDLSHQDEETFEPLQACRTEAQRLIDQLIADELSASDIAALVDGTNVLGALAEIADPTNQVSDARWTELQAVLQESNGEFLDSRNLHKSLWTAIARGKVVRAPRRMRRKNAVRRINAGETEPSDGLTDSEMDLKVLGYDESSDDLGDMATEMGRPRTISVADALLAQWDREDELASQVETKSDDDSGDSGWIFDDVDSGRPGSPASLIMGTGASGRNSLFSRGSKLPDRSAGDESESDTDHHTLISGETDVECDTENVIPAKPEKIFRFVMYGTDTDEELLIPRRMLRNGWRFSEVVLLEFYRRICKQRRDRGFTACCSLPFREIAMTLAMPQRRVREACVMLDERGEIAISASKSRECRVWLTDDPTLAAGQRPERPSPVIGESPNGSQFSTRHAFPATTLCPGLRGLLSDAVAH